MGAPDLYERIGEGVAQVVVGALPAAINNVYTAITTLWETAAYPCVFVTWDNAIEKLDMDFENNLDSYPVAVFICDRQDVHDQQWRATMLAWRKQLMDAFRPLVALGNAPEVWNVEIDPKVVFDPNLPQYQHVVSGFIVRSSCTEPRAKL